MRLSVRLASAILCVVLAGTAGRAAGQPLVPVPLHDLGAFRPAGDRWQVVGDAWALWDDASLATAPGTGVLVNRAGAGRGDPLFTAWDHGDLVLELDYLLPQGGGSGLFLQGRYAVQLADSWGAGHPTYDDAGGIAQRYDAARASGQAAFEGHPPRADASRAPGLWQHLRVVFEAPRFDDAGRKVANARFVEVVLNGVTVQEDVEVTGPTRGAAFAGEAPAGPLVLQGDDGAAAFRDVRYRMFEPVVPARLSGVRYALYEGEFAGLDELEAAEPVRTGASHGYVWDLFGTRADRFGTHWTGTLHVPRTGPYRFGVGFNWVDDIPYDEDAVPGHGRLTIDGRTVVAHEGAEPFATGSVVLEAGAHPFTLTYFKNRQLWRPIVFLRVEGPGMPEQLLNAPRTVPEPESSAPPLAVAPAAEPFVLRSFVYDDTVKVVNAVSVGDPRGVHYTLDLDDGGLRYAWKGAFADVGAMWYSRGERQVAVPLGQRIDLPAGPALAVLPDAAAPWPAARPAEAERPAAPRFGGYTLDAEGRPTFRYTLAGMDVRERLTPSPDGRTLARRLDLRHDLQGGAPPAGLWLRAAAGADVRAVRPGVYRVDGAYFVRVEGDGAAVVHAPGGRQELRLPVRFDAGRAEAAYTIVW